jgi:hypothetical protein
MSAFSRCGETGNRVTAPGRPSASSSVRGAGERRWLHAANRLASGG